MSIPSPPAAFPTDWSLAAIADRLPPLPFERSDGSVEAQDRELPHPLCFWYRLNYYIGTQHSKLPQFAPEQWASYQLLHDWWTAKYQDASFSLAAALRVLDYSGTLLNADELTEESKRAFDAIFSHLRLKRWPIGDILDPEPRQLPQSLNQHYHDRLWELFRCEFLFESCYYPCRENETNFATRRGARNTATVYGYCQQLGWLAFSEGLSGSSKPEELPLKTTERADNDAIFNIAINGPVLKPCPWLDKEELDDLQNLPRFLWDIEACCTMDTLLIEPRPDYIAISHTWGRWATGERVSIEGVSWLIPTNTRFDVEDLPQILKRAPGNIRYIWLDLLCIPQDGSKIGAQEIARQAKIFRGARLAIAWLSEVHSLEGLGSIIRWMSLELMLVHGQRNEEQRARAVDAAWSAVSGKVSGLLEPREGSLQFGNLALNPWFTSLWTLQEVCLRPDMWICAADWTFLTASHGLAVSVVGFVAILETWRRAYPKGLHVPYHPEPEKQRHIALFEVGHWRFSSGLDKLLDLDQAAIVTLGDRRHCEKRRAEAIMSALGATDWYNNALTNYETSNGWEEILEKDLVLGKYPLDFVNEIAAKVPKSFFSAFQRLNIDLSVGPTVRDGSSEGTLLPFSRHGSYFAEVTNFRPRKIHSVAHESLSTWKVQVNGSVQIPRACLMSSSVEGRVKIQDVPIIPIYIVDYIQSGHTNTAPLPPEIKAFSDDLEDPMWMSLHHWAMQQANEVFLLLTEYRYVPIKSGTYDPKCLQGCGIILEMVGGAMVKRWHFMFHDELVSFNVAQSQQVDWLVS